MALDVSFLPILFLLSCLVQFPSCAAVDIKMIIAPSKTVVVDQKVQVSCYVNNLRPSDMRRFALYFYCPVFSIDSDIACFQNCSSSCAHSGCRQQKRLSEFSCTRYAYGSSLTFEYTLSKAKLNSAGHFRCTFMGRSTETLKLNVIEPEILRPAPVAPPKPVPPPKPKPKPLPPKPAPPKKTPPPASKVSAKPKDPTTLPLVPGKHPGRVRVTRPGSEEDRRSPSPGHTKRRNVSDLVNTGHSLLFVVVLLFLLSLLINTIFLIRCVLIWFYGSSDNKIRMGNLLCMSEEIRVIREKKDSHYSMLALPLGEPTARPLLMHHPPGMVRQHSAEQPVMRVPYPHPPGMVRQHSAEQSQMRVPYPQKPSTALARPQSQHSNDSGPQVMRVISEIELQPGELPEDQTIMYVQVPIMVQKNGSVTALTKDQPPVPQAAQKTNGHAGGRPQSVFLQSGPLETVGRRSRLSTSTSSIDRIRRSSRGENPERILSMESVFQMEPLHE